MLSNHFPHTYGHDYNWVILLLISAGGAAIREYFVVRLNQPKRSKIFGIIGIALLTFVIYFSQKGSESFKTEKATPHSHLIHEQKDPAPETSSGEKMYFSKSNSNKKFHIQGKVFFEGQPPVSKKLNLPSGCQNQGDREVFSNEVLIRDGKIQNVLIRVTRGLEGLVFKDIPAEEVRLNQLGCLYQPRVVAARVGQKVTFINSDPIFHNVRSVTNLNQKFNVAMPKKNQTETRIFNRAELFVQAKCSVHPWMGAYVAVMDHPYFDVTDENGDFSLPDLPEGHYLIEAWHEIFGTLTQELRVGPNENTTLNFTFKRSL
jgi:plastocyanin